MKEWGSVGIWVRERIVWYFIEGQIIPKAEWELFWMGSVFGGRMITRLQQLALIRGKVHKQRSRV